MHLPVKAQNIMRNMVLFAENNNSYSHECIISKIEEICNMELLLVFKHIDERKWKWKDRHILINCELNGSMETQYLCKFKTENNKTVPLTSKMIELYSVALDFRIIIIQK